MRLLVCPFGLHAAHHTFASLGRAAGRSIRWVAEPLGHANPALTLGVQHAGEKRGYGAFPRP